MPNGSIERMNDTAESFTTWLDKLFFTLKNMKINGVVHQKHHLKYIDENYTVHQTKPHLTLHGILKAPEFVNPEHLDIISTQSLHHLKSQITGENKDHPWVILTAKQKWNFGNCIPISSNIVHLKNWMNTTINLEKYGPPVLT